MARFQIHCSLSLGQQSPLSAGGLVWKWPPLRGLQWPGEFCWFSGSRQNVRGVEDRAPCPGGLPTHSPCGECIIPVASTRPLPTLSTVGMNKQLKLHLTTSPLLVLCPLTSSSLFSTSAHVLTSYLDPYWAPSHPYPRLCSLGNGCSSGPV